LLGRFHVSLSWAEILRRTFVDAFFKHNCLGLAAQLAYYFFFSLFPALIFLIAIASYFPITTLMDQIVGSLRQFAPPELIAIVTDQIRKISGNDQGGLLTLGILTALWSSSTAMTAIIDTVNHAYGVEEGRAWWKVRVIAIALTIGVALFVLASFALIIIGPQLADPIADAIGLGTAFEWTWRLLQFPVACVLASVGIALVYYFAPDVDQHWTWLAPGTIFATVLWLGASLGFRYYVINVTRYTETYGALGGAMVLLLWFYMSGFVLLLGAVLNAKIEHAAPIGKNPGEKVEGQRRRISREAMRRWISARRHRHEPPPSADDIRKVTQ
jgi:membrane protein